MHASQAMKVAIEIHVAYKTGVALRDFAKQIGETMSARRTVIGYRVGKRSVGGRSGRMTSVDAVSCESEVSISIAY